jgi:putative ABC transport system permease protein
LLTESTLLGLLAGAGTLPFTWALTHVLATKFADAFPAEEGTVVFHVTPDLAVVAYVLAISLTAGVLFGLTPALEASRSALYSAFKGNAGTPPARSRRLQDFLITAQVAVSLVLMITGSMFTRSAIHALKMEAGYDSKHVVDLDLRFPEDPRYTAGRKLSAVRELRTRLASLPGVARITSALPPADGGFRTAAVALGGKQYSAQDAPSIVHYSYVQSNYFETLGIPMFLGRTFQTQSGEPEHSVILSQSAASELWPGENPIGRSLRLGGTDERVRNRGALLADGPSYQVVGVARDTRGIEFDGSDSKQVYLPLSEDRVAEQPILIRTQSDPAQVIRAIDPVIESFDLGLIASASTLEEMLRQTAPFIVSSLAAAVASTVGLLGLLLASMGIYGRSATSWFFARAKLASAWRSAPKSATSWDSCCARARDPCLEGCSPECCSPWESLTYCAVYFTG